MIQVSGIPGYSRRPVGSLATITGTISFWWERATSYAQISRGPISTSVADCQLVSPGAMAKPCSHNVRVRQILSA